MTDYELETGDDVRTGHAGDGADAPGGGQPVSASLRPGDLLELEVGSVAAGGSCVARAPDGRVVFVRHSLPGELVRARLTGISAHFARADAVEVIAAAPERVEPPCPHAGPGRCGGCDWQHVALPAQRALKADLVRQALSRLAGLDPDVVVEPVGRPDGLAWRSRVRFGVARSGRVGLRRHRSNDLELVRRCPIASEEVESAGVEARTWRGASEVEVFAPPGGGVLVSVSPRPGSPRRSPPQPAASAQVGVGRRGSSGHAVMAEGAGLDFRVSPGSFWQVHVDAPGVLVPAVLEALAPRPGDRVVDLHAGVGLFAAHLARAVGPGGRVLAVERDPVASADAVANAAGLSQLEVRRASVSAPFVESLEGFDLAVLDPPRSGAGVEVMRALARRSPPLRRIAYVACDPASLARDLRAAVDVGWTLSGLRAFELFPMTEHVELLAVLEPAASS